jgi:hydrogenase small subunit
MPTTTTRRLSRREFLKLGGMFAAGALLPGTAVRVFAAGFESIQEGLVKIVWLQGQSCSGCSVSLLNTRSPNPADLLTRYISLVFHQSIGAAQGHTAMEILDTMAGQKGYILVVEGSIPLKIPEACTMDGRPFADILKQLIPNAAYVVAEGTCAAFGGIPAAEGNPTGSASVGDFMAASHLTIDKRLVNLPGCPGHPTTIVGTLAYLAAKGYPDQVHPQLLTPAMFFKNSTHDECPRYHYYERQQFAGYLGDAHGCLFKLGCLGPLTFNQCPHRQWNSGINWCIRAAAPCIGCSSPDFAKRKSLAFYRKGETYRTGIARTGQTTQ